MQVFNPFVFLVIGLAFGQKSSIAPDTDSTTSTTESTKTTTFLSTTISSTTEPSTKRTTEAPSSTTPEIQTTTEIHTTTEVVTTTKPPGPVEGHWSVSDGNVTCIRADLIVEFKIPDINDTIFLLPNASAAGSSCTLSNVTQILVLKFEDYNFSLEFEKDATKTFVKNVSFSSNAVGSDTFYNDSKLFPVKNGNSYLCKSKDEISLGNATMHIFKIKIQAFGVANETEFSTSEECELDDSVSDVVPIAVSCALAGLIIIVLIAYLIGRRGRQTGYTTV